MFERLKKISKKKWIFILSLIFVLWFVPWVYVLHAGFLIYFPYERDGVTRYVRTTGPVAKVFGADWVPSEEIPRQCKRALVAAEDMKFYEHIGIDPDSIEQALKRNLKRKRALGASTITQQLVKNAFLSRKRSYIRKAREIVGALLLDVAMNKTEQITWYFNVVEFGPTTYGIKAAAKRYFKKSPKQLSTSECAKLVSLLPDPTRSYRAIETKKYPRYLQKRMGRIQKSMY